MTRTNRQWILVKRPPAGPISAELFQLREQTVPDLKDGEYLVQNQLLSFDPTQRVWMQQDSYIPMIPLGEVMRSLGLGKVVESRNSAFPVGSRVSGLLGWQDFSLRGGPSIFPDQIVGQEIPDEAALSVFGLTGLTAFFGMHRIGAVKEGDTVLVSGASGATGSIAAQIAKLRGAKKVIGIAGGSKKCQWLLEKAGIDAAIDYKSEDLEKRLQEESPEGIDLYFDNVGGSTLDTALAHLRLNARVVLCGAISAYEGSTDGAISNYFMLTIKRATMQGFLFSDHMDLVPLALDQLDGWVRQGKIHYEVDVQEGLENAPATLGRIFAGANFGKQLLRLNKSEGS